MYVSAIYTNIGAHHLIPFAHFEVIVFLSQTPHGTGKNLTVLPKASPPPPRFPDYRKRYLAASNLAGDS